ncbi:tRNA a64-2'-O-ribosylphosphate transferase [Histoplasma capsulatum var. duboisii H88]|uniref:tRNA a64-2'-O-ribosylphosphate transferase n=2 Tax=Ajellomyces capsulatus (strain H88) TaxID=544711 RepID=F0USS4_AJEC8|nr:tRNA a64-2'-O-ribosylphosphate transferase [Histoplasma capsulatum var. duboisii H88]
MANPSPYPTSISSLHFPSSAHQSISQVLSSLRKSALSITNRLWSIEEDSEFAEHVADHYGLPLVANERCGSWYIPTDRKAGSAYFKSTDGHEGQWDFSLRRLNLQLLDILRENGGCVIVDSTRRGKSMPDALSKTVPIWTAVLNRALFPNEKTFHDVQFPPDFLGASEESQIEKRIDGFVISLNSLKLNMQGLQSRLGKPIRLTWFTRELLWPEYTEKEMDAFHLIVLCSASKRVQGAEMSEGGYIQGAGDDSELWSCGLTPKIFWDNRSTLFATGEEDLPAVIAELIGKHHREMGNEDAVLIRPTNNIYIGRSGRGSNSEPAVVGINEERLFDLRINCNAPDAGDTDTSLTEPTTEEDAKALSLGCPSGKLGSRQLRKVLNKVEQFVALHLSRDPSQSLIVTCDNGKDLSAGAILMIICLFYNEEGNFEGPRRGAFINKEYIRQRLAWVISSKHDVNPSRSTLQSVHAFLMKRP